MLDGKGAVKAAVGIKLERVTDPETGKTVARDIPGSEFEVKCELVLIAAGYTGAEPALLAAFGLTADTHGNAAVRCPASHRTGREKIFVAGDMRRGPSLVVWAIREGRETAREVDTFLMGYSAL